MDDNTVKSYYQILEETHLGFFLEPYHRSVRKRQINSPKFYFFDTGVQRALQKTLNSLVVENTYAFGKAFEHYVLMECVRLNMYHRLDYQFFFLNVSNGQEIDLIIERPGMPAALVEIKSSLTVDDRDTATLSRLQKDFGMVECYCLSRDPSHMRIGSVSCLPWQDGLKKLGF